MIKSTIKTEEEEKEERRIMRRKKSRGKVKVVEYYHESECMTNDINLFILIIFLNDPVQIYVVK